jgi:LacI family transcriptional regulator
MAPVRLKDIARDLGVSAVTVSKVLRDHPDIGESTKERVLKRVKELQYRPNLMARGLVTGKTSLVALVIPDLVHSFFAEVAIAVSQTLRRAGYSMLIAWTAEDSEMQYSEIEHLLSLGIDAMIIATSGGNDLPSFQLLETRNIPYVLLDRQMSGIRAPFVGMDDRLAGFLATQHLIENGSKRIAHICGPSMSTGHNRLQGYKDALQEAGLPIREQYIVTPLDAGPMSFSHGFEATQRLLAITPRIDGIFCFNDPLAIGAIEAILAAELRIPDDIAVIGCGNHVLGASLRLPLSTIDQDTKALGEKSAKTLLGMLRKPEKTRSARQTILEPRLIIRATSTRKSRKGGAAAQTNGSNGKTRSAR